MRASYWLRQSTKVSSHFEPLWAISLKESGYVGLVDYSQQDFPLVSNIATERFLHDGGFDHTGRYFLVAANVFALPNCAAINLQLICVK